MVYWHCENQLNDGLIASVIALEALQRSFSANMFYLSYEESDKIRELVNELEQAKVLMYDVKTRFNGLKEEVENRLEQEADNG
jgi:CHASE3 domain sensor protein